MAVRNPTALPLSVETDIAPGGAKPIDSTAVGNGQALVFDSASGRWKPTSHQAPRLVPGQPAALSMAPNTWGTQAGPGQFVTLRQMFTCPSVGVADLRCRFENWACLGSPPGGEVTPGNQIQIKAAIEYNGVTYPVYFRNGQRTVTLDDGASIESDPVGIEIPAGATYYVRTLCMLGSTATGTLVGGANTVTNFIVYSGSFVNGQTVSSIAFSNLTISTGAASPLVPGSAPASLTLSGNSGANETNDAIYTPNSFKHPVAGIGSSSANGEGYTTRFNLVDATGNGSLTALTGVGPFGVSAIYGTPLGTPTKSVFIAGDSSAHGKGDTYRGWLARGCGTSRPSIKVASDGEEISAFLTSRALRSAYASSCDYAIDEYGINDIDLTSESVATIEADMVAVWLALFNRGLAVARTTLGPVTVQTTPPGDYFTSTAAQSLYVGTGHQAFIGTINTWLRAGAPLDPGTLAPVAVGTGGAIVCPVYSTAGALLTPGNSSAHPLSGVGVIDQAGLVNNGAGLWLPATGTGTTTNGSNQITGLAMSFATLQAGGDPASASNWGSYVSGPGITAGTYITAITGAPGSQTATMSANAGAAAGTGAINGSLTGDGTHPNIAGHILMAGAINPALMFP